MHSFEYRNGSLFCENVDLAGLAAQTGTPAYVYSAATILDHYRRLDEALAGVPHLICYAVKANSNIAILNLLAKEGAGFDIVSGGELFRVAKAGGNPAQCTFAGVGKTEAEIREALQRGILAFNVESEAELAQINRVAAGLGVKAPVAVRVNPDVDAHTHKYISTGKSENKFGITFERVAAVYEAASKLPHLHLRGVQMHIGSQITEAGPFAEAVDKMLPLVCQLKIRYGIEYFSIGGGMGIVYDPSLASGAPGWWKSDASEGRLTVAEYAAAVVPKLKALGLKILVEPGRVLVGNAGVLLTRALYVKQSETKKFVIVDAGMNDLIRPALYQSFHEIVPVAEPAPQSPPAKVDIVGPVCESGDFFAQDRELPPLAEGDLLAVMSAGAYGAAMSSTYNSRPLLPEILVHGDRFAVIRRRQTPEDLVRDESLPQW
ncbi:MAG: diaminopimelate decarboxylase [Chthoniobacteraceae bacterium]|nr:diaminopimelate decarboxylase [Chthoniobacteraceae bacterium]